MCDKALPLVSIVTPCYNAERWLPGFFFGVLSQTLKNWELILIDDCSFDQTGKIISEYASRDERIKYTRLHLNSGPSVARNQGVAQSIGRYIAFLDVDDLWHPSKLEIQIAWMNAFSIGMSYHDYRHISADGSAVGHIVKGPNHLSWSLLHKRRGVGCLSIVFDRELCPLPVFPEQRDKFIAEDLVAWLSVLKQGVIARRLPLCLAYYRISPSSRSSNKFNAFLSVWNIYRVVSKISFLKCLWYISCYCIHSSFIHMHSRPCFQVDGCKKAHEIEMN